MDKFISCVVPGKNLAFADAICLLAISTKYLNENLKVLEEEAARLGLTINKEKTKYMVNTRNKARWRNFTHFEEYKSVGQFKYLGGIIMENNDVKEEIKARLAAGNKCYYIYQKKTFKSSLVTIKLKLLAYKTIIKPVVMYGSETWSLTKKDENLLNTWERKVFRRIFGAVCTNNEWRIRTNSELKEIYKAPTIVADIKARRLGWLGLVERMENHRVQKKSIK